MPPHRDNQGMTPHRKGILLALAAVLLWSTSAAGILWSSTRVGPWQFLAIACLIGGLAQVAFYRRRRYAWRQILLPPPRLWGLILLCFVAYMIVFTLGLVSAVSDTQRVGVALANYLWPTLTVVLAVLLVPGTKMHVRLAIGVGIALLGLAMANWGDIRRVLGNDASVPLTPYILGLAAAVTWAAYSAILSRWRASAAMLPTAPLAFLLTGLIAAAICTLTGSWRAVDLASWAGIAFVGLGPQGLGYLLWELALHKAPAGQLGLLGSLTPVLSTLWLLWLFRAGSGGQTTADIPVLLASAGLIGCAVLVGRSDR